MYEPQSRVFLPLYVLSHCFDRSINPPESEYGRKSGMYVIPFTNHMRPVDVDRYIWYVMLIILLRPSSSSADTGYHISPDGCLKLGVFDLTCLARINGPSSMRGVMLAIHAVQRPHPLDHQRESEKGRRMSMKSSNYLV